MFDDIRNVLNDFSDAHKDELSVRDGLGINKIMFELDLLEKSVKPKKSKKKTLAKGSKPQ